MEFPPKYCPDCGEEYVHHAAQCADCGVALVLEPPSVGGPVGALPERDRLVAVRSGETSWVRGLAEELSAAGIPSRVERGESEPSRRGHGPRLTLYVRPEDAPRAAEIDATYARTQVPDLPEEASSGWAETEGCPACGTALADDAAECPECGLVIAPAE